MQFIYANKKTDDLEDNIKKLSTLKFQIFSKSLIIENVQRLLTELSKK